MERRVALVADRGRRAGTITTRLLHPVWELAIRRAARDAHRLTCLIDALACHVCRVHPARLSGGEGSSPTPHDLISTMLRRHHHSYQRGALSST
jgi:hypothetical protein